MQMQNERQQYANHYGTHRVLDVHPALPQAAHKLDNSLPIFNNEILIDVECLNIDAASFVQMEEETGKDVKKIGEIILENSQIFGKQQNKITGSGGMLIGRVCQIGSKYKGSLKCKVGDRIATLVSLTLTPLQINKIKSIDLKTHQVEVEGKAVLFESSIAAILPKNIPEKIAMAALDVAGAPATTYALCQKSKTVVIIGAGGKAGLLSCVAARKKIGPSGKLIAIEPFEKAANDLKALGVCSEILKIDATNSVAVHAGVEAATRGKMGDIVINVASVPNTEVSSLLSAKKNGKILFFSMATAFSKVTLGAEAISTEAVLIFGNGYYKGHSDFVLSLLQKNNKLKNIFYSRYQ
jgi:L-erythro-3,5-diaminohexanoate dehydrogenase